MDHAGHRHQHGNRDHQCRDQRRAEVAEQQEQDDDHEQRALGQVLRHRLDGCIDQEGAVENRLGVNARRQRLVDLLHFGVDGSRDRAAVAANQHQGSADHHLLPVLRGRAGAHLPADRHLGNVPHPDRNATAGGHDHVADLLHALQASGRAHHIALAVALDIAGAAADVVGLDRIGHVLKRQPKPDQLRRIGLNVILLHVAADRVDAGHVRHAFELWADDPVLHGTQVSRPQEIVGEALPFGRKIGAIALPARLAILDGHAGCRRRILDRPHVDLAQTGGDRSHLRFGARRQAGFGVAQALVDLLAGEVDVRALTEHGGHLREAVARE